MQSDKVDTPERFQKLKGCCSPSGEKSPITLSQPLHIWMSQNTKANGNSIVSKIPWIKQIRNTPAEDSKSPKKDPPPDLQKVAQTHL